MKGRDPLRFLFVFFGSLLPGIIWFRWFYRRGYWQPDTFKLIGKAFLFGAIVVLPGIFLEMPLVPYFYARRTLTAALLLSLGVGIIEEAAKVAALISARGRKREADEEIDVIGFFIASIAAGLGFALSELLFYHFYFDIPAGILRAMTNGLAYSGYAGFFGYFYCYAMVFNKNNTAVYGLFGFFAAVFLHAVFDFVLISGIMEPRSGIFFLLGLHVVLFVLILPLGQKVAGGNEI